MKKKVPKHYTTEQLKKELFKNPGVKKAYDGLQPEFAIVQAIIDARVKKKITQEELARRMGTGQAVVSRLENANASPSLALIKRLAEALDLKVEIHFRNK